MSDFSEINGSDQVRDISRGGIVRGIRADADPRGFLEEDPLYGNLYEVTLELALDVVACPWRQFSRDIHTIAIAEFSAEARGNEI